MKLPKWLEDWFLANVDIDEKLADAEQQLLTANSKITLLNSALATQKEVYEREIADDQEMMESMNDTIKSFENPHEKTLDRIYGRSRIEDFTYKKRWVIGNKDNMLPMSICDFVRPSPLFYSLFKGWTQKKIWELKIEYVSDNFAYHGIPEVWQLPEETLFLRTGDCEDSGSLRASIAVSLGMKDIFCALGYYNGTGHFFNIRLTAEGNIVILEPTENKYNPVRIEGTKYKIHYIFNQNAVWTVDGSSVFGMKVKNAFNIVEVKE